MTGENLSKPNMAVKIAGVEFKNPVTVASGTFASGKEYGEFFDIGELGAITTKGVSYEPWKGNPPPRIAETYGGMLNAVGLQNNGVEWLIKNDLPILAEVREKSGTRVIVNICGHSIDEYCNVAFKVCESGLADMLELNISCPNIKEGGIAFGTDWKMAEKVVASVKKVMNIPLVVKLSPNVTSISVIARAAESSGADALSMINTVMGMKIDITKRKPLLANRVGGLSGPAVMPIAVRCVYQAYQAVKIPIIGMGGIMSGEDAMEFIMAGAAMVAVGTAHFTDPCASLRVRNEIEGYLLANGVGDVNGLVGAAANKEQK